MKQTFRSIGAILAGFFFVGLVGFVVDTALQAIDVLPETGSVRFADWQSALALSYHLVATLLAAYLTAWLAPNRPIGHALILGGLGVAISTVGLIAIISGDLAPAWYGWALIIFSLPVTWLGGWLYARRLPAKRGS